MLPVDKQRGTLPGFLANPDNGVIAPVPVAFVLLAYPLVKPLIQAGEDSPQGRFSILTHSCPKQENKLLYKLLKENGF